MFARIRSIGRDDSPEMKDELVTIKDITAYKAGSKLLWRVVYANSLGKYSIVIDWSDHELRPGVKIPMHRLNEHVATVGEIKHWRTLSAAEVEKESRAKADAV